MLPDIIEIVRDGLTAFFSKHVSPSLGRASDNISMTDVRIVYAEEKAVLRHSRASIELLAIIVAIDEDFADVEDQQAATHLINKHKQCIKEATNAFSSQEKQKANAMLSLYLLEALAELAEYQVITMEGKLPDGRAIDMTESIHYLISQHAKLVTGGPTANPCVQEESALVAGFVLTILNNINNYRRGENMTLEQIKALIDTEIVKCFCIQMMTTEGYKQYADTVKTIVAMHAACQKIVVETEAQYVKHLVEMHAEVTRCDDVATVREKLDELYRKHTTLSVASSDPKEKHFCNYLARTILTTNDIIKAEEQLDDINVATVTFVQPDGTDARPAEHTAPTLVPPILMRRLSLEQQHPNTSKRLSARGGHFDHSPRSSGSGQATDQSPSGSPSAKI